MNTALTNDIDNKARIVTCDGKFIGVCHYRHTTKLALKAIRAGGSACEILSSNGKEVLGRVWK